MTRRILLPVLALPLVLLTTTACPGAGDDDAGVDAGPIGDGDGDGDGDDDDDDCTAFGTGTVGVSGNLTIGVGYEAGAGIAIQVAPFAASIYYYGGKSFGVQGSYGGSAGVYGNGIDSLKGRSKITNIMLLAALPGRAVSSATSILSKFWNGSIFSSVDNRTMGVGSAFKLGPGAGVSVVPAANTGAIDLVGKQCK